MKRLIGGYLGGAALALAAAGALASASVSARELTLDEALTIALNETGRGGILTGNLEVAEQNYFAEKINFYLPEISINGSVPAYRVNETYDFLPGTDQKSLGKRTFLDYDADITLNQSLITGGTLTLRSNLVDNDWEYPVQGLYATEKRRTGTFNFLLSQPILQPSEAKHRLKNTRDDLEIARFTQIEDRAKLQKEVVEAFIGVLQSEVTDQISAFKLEASSLKAGIDSLKLMDGVIANEDWLDTYSARLDAELEKFETDNTSAERRRALAELLDWETPDDIVPTEPSDLAHPNQELLQRLIDRWDESIPILRARHAFAKSNRGADFAASSHGLRGSVEASYGMERGDVESSRSLSGKEDLDLDSWGVSLKFTYPLWDGGASSAAVKSARLTAEQARLEYEKAQKSARAEIVNLINRLDVAYRKLEVLRQQIGVAQNRLNIASGRLDDGQISRLTFLENQVSYLEAKDRYLEEVKTYFLTRVELEGKYIN